MTTPFQEIFRRRGLKPVRIVRVSAPLGAEQFPPDTVFINQTGRLPPAGGLLELESKPCKGLTPGKCYLPDIPLYTHKSAVPEIFSKQGQPAAFIGKAGAAAAERIPAAIEFPGNRFWFNFDPEQTIRLIERELYFTKKRPLHTRLPFNIQKVPPSLRQIASRFLKSGNKKRGTALFPSYPKDFSVELLTNLLLRPAGDTTGRGLASSLWPDGKKYAFILTHDVDSDWLYQGGNLPLFLDVETRLGIRAAWYFVCSLYKHDVRKLARLASAGHEIGLHGDNHDHKIAFLSRAAMVKRLDGCRRFIDENKIAGFRSPHYLRTPLFYEVLKNYVRYDTSMHDSYNPATPVDTVREGCSAIHPFTLSDDPGALLELPVTIPEDYELYDPARGASSIITPQLEQIAEIKRRGGLANLVIHTESHFSARKDCFEAFKEVLGTVAGDKDCWLCRPDELWAYWTAK